MIQEVYILGESPTKDGLNLDYICKDLTSLSELAKVSFENRFNKEDEMEIHSINILPDGGIEINYCEGWSGEMINTFTQYYYLTKPLK